MISEELLWAYHPFNTLKKHELTRLLSYAETHVYNKDEVIYKEQEASDAFYFLLKGRVVALATIDGREERIELITKGTSFGIISLFTDEPHSVTTKAIEPSTVLKIEKKQFKEFLLQVPRLALDLSIILSKRVKKRVDAPKKIFKSTSLLVMGNARDTYAYTYALAVAKQLTRDAKKKVLVVEVSCDDSFLLSSFVASAVPAISTGDAALQEDGFTTVSYGGIEYVCFRIDPEAEASIDSLTNCFSENYHFIFYIYKDMYTTKLGLHFLEAVDAAHIVSELNKDALYETVRLVKMLKTTIGDLKPIEVSLVTGGGSVSVAYAGQALPRRIYALLRGVEEYDEGVFARIGRFLSEKAIGVALGSGGAYGAAHVGVLKSLDKNKVCIDMICGSSVGSMVASMWALGYSYDAMRQHLVTFGKYLRLLSFRGISLPFKGILRAKRTEAVCKTIFGNKTFYDTHCKLKVIAFNFKRRKISVLENGYIYKAVAASCALPGIFEPILYEGDILFDGGILSPLPTKALLNANIKKIIAVNIAPHKEDMSRVYQKKTRFNIFDFIFGSIETMQQEFIKDSLEVADVIIHPHLEDLSWTDFNQIIEIMQRGEKATEQKIDHIETLSRL